MLSEFPPPAVPEPPPPPPRRFWPDFWKGFGLCLLLCLVIGFVFVLALGVTSSVAQPLVNLLMVATPLAGLLPLAFVTAFSFNRRPTGQRAALIIGAAICYGFLTLLPLVICFGVLVAMGR